MISKRSKLSLCQFLDLQPKATLDVLLSKHGIDAKDYDLRRLAAVIQVAATGQLSSLLSEVIRTKGDLRNRVTPRYSFDERWDDLGRCLFLDGYKVGDDQLVAVDLTIEGAEALIDDLASSLNESGSALNYSNAMRGRGGQESRVYSNSIDKFVFLVPYHQRWHQLP